jgi:DNA polymerase-3 subunit alpha
VVINLNAADFGPTLLEELKSVFANFPGECEVMLVMQTRSGSRKLRFGREYRVAPSHGLRAELDSLLGPHALAA